MPKNWIKGALAKNSNKGGLHRALKVKGSKSIPAKKLAKAANSKNPHLRHMAQFAENMRHLNKHGD